jgi:CBS domain-containing protein
MLVKDLMTADVKTCSEESDLATAARMMWDGDCGIVPVLNREHRVIGVVTDRDICIAAATRSRNPADIRVSDVMSRDITTCAQDNDIRTALALLRNHRVRRLPVVDAHGRLTGIISMSDIAGQAECRRGAEVPGDEFLQVLKTISAHPTPAGPAA